MAFKDKPERGDVLPSHNTPTFEDVEGDIIIATERTVKNGRGSAAYTIHFGLVPGSVHGVLLVDGHHRHMTSYHAKLCGILGAIILLYKLLDNIQQWEAVSGTIWCNSKAAVKAFDKLTGAAPFSLTTADRNDSDVLQELRY